MAEGMEWKKPEVQEHERRGTVVDLDIVESWLQSETNPDKILLLNDLLSIEEFDGIEASKLLDEIITTGVKTQDEVTDIILPGQAAVYAAFTSAITGENLLRLLDIAPKSGLASLLIDASHFGGKFVPFKLLEIGKRVPDNFLRWALRFSNGLMGADATSDKSVYMEVTTEWVLRIDADSARAVLMLTDEDNPKLDNELQSLLANKVTPAAATEIVCSHKVVKQLTAETVQILWDKVPKDQMELALSNTVVLPER